MKILHLIYSMGPGGAQRLVLDLCNGLTAGHEVTLLTIEDHDDRSEFDHTFFLSELSPEIEVINLKSRGNSIRSFFRIFRLIRQRQPDIVHAHSNTIIYLFIPSLIFRRIRYFHTLHSIASKDLALRQQKSVNAFFYRRRYIQPVTISESVRSSFLKFYGFDNSVMIRNGREKLARTGEYESVKLEIDKLKIHPNDLVFIHCARFSEAKNQQMLIAVFNRLLSEGHHLILLIIGPSFDTPEAREIVSGSRKGIFYLGTRNNIGDYLFCSDAFCLSSLWEGLPISLIEAISCGLTPICTPAGGVPDVVSDGKTGYLSEDFSQESYYKAIKRFLEKGDKINSRDLIDYFNSNFSIGLCVAGHIQTYGRDGKG